MRVEIYQEPWSCSMVYERRHRIDPKPAYQRGPVWRLHQQQRLIDSILRSYDIPKFYLARPTPPRPPYDHEVTDGQQRLRAIWAFLEDEYPLGPDSEDLPEFGDLSGKRFSELPDEAKDRVKLFRLTVAEIRNASDEELRELFLRLQEGESLNPAEKRNAIAGGMRDFVAMLGDEHKVFPLTHLRSSRLGWHDLAAHVVRLELEEGPADVKAPDLRAMYESNAAFSSDSDDAKRVIEVLDYMADVLRDRPPEMRIKWGFVDLYLAISHLMHRTSIDTTDQKESFLLMFRSFEQERLSVDDPAELLGPDRTESDRDMFRYIEAFTRDGATKSNIEARHQVYLRRLALEMPSLAT